MEMTSSKLTVFFENPFWVGIYECEYGGKYEVAKITFGAEPKDYEVYEFILKNWNDLKFSPKVDTKISSAIRMSPKRMRRLISKQLQQNTVIGTKAQNALKEQHSQIKIERKIKSREVREAEKERKFELKQEKRKQKHRGH